MPRASSPNAAQLSPRSYSKLGSASRDDNRYRSDDILRWLSNVSPLGQS
jgi:hypothetical protein